MRAFFMPTWSLASLEPYGQLGALRRGQHD